jgi:hypothetical protein
VLDGLAPAAGAVMEFGAHRGPRGVVTSVSSACGTNYKVTLGGNTAATPTGAGTLSYPANCLAGRGDGTGYLIRFFGNSAGGGGCTSIHEVVANTAGTTPTALAIGDAYEIVSGSLMCLGGGAVTAKDARYYNCIPQDPENVPGATPGQKPLASGTDSALVCLDENLAPLDRNPFDGFLGVLTSTASGAATITGQAANAGNDGDANVVADEYKNFQIVITKDVTNPRAVSQRRLITAHTAGASPQYTVAAWTFQPTAGAEFVITYPNWWLWQPQGTTALYVMRETPYSYGGLSTWTTPFGVRGGNAGAGMTLLLTSGMIQDNSILPADAATLRPNRYSHVHSHRGGGVVFDLIDIAALTITATTVNGAAVTLAAGASYAQDLYSNGGKFTYVSLGAACYVWNLNSRDWLPWVIPPNALGTLVQGNRMGAYTYYDGTTPITRIFMDSLGSNGFYECYVTGYFG